MTLWPQREKTVYCCVAVVFNDLKNTINNRTNLTTSGPYFWFVSRGAHPVRRLMWSGAAPFTYICARAHASFSVTSQCFADLNLSLTIWVQRSGQAVVVRGGRGAKMPTEAI